MASLRIMSWNVNGLNSANKRRRVFHWIKKQKCDIIGMQETHIKRSDSKYIMNKYIGEEFYSLTDKKKRGVVTYINKNLNPKKVFSDKQGRYIAMEITNQNEKNLIINLYAPNGSKLLFFQEIQKQINSYTYENIIMLGDYNGTINNEMDRSEHKSKKDLKKGKLPSSFFKLKEDENLVDVWRQRNPKEKDFTFYSD